MNIVIGNQKGGVGKTAASVNLAYAAAKAGNETLLIDLDPQGASSFYFPYGVIINNFSSFRLYESK